MHVYSAVKQGVYRHEILGVASTEARAVEIGKHFVTSEHDHYHSVTIVRSTVDESDTASTGAVPEEVVGVVRPVWGNGQEFKGVKYVPGEEG